MFAIFVTGVSIWIVYGLIIADIPVILTNVATLALAGIILIFKIRNG